MIKIHILNKFQDNPYRNSVTIDTTSHSETNKDLSPFYLGPVTTYVPGVMAANVENYWQYSKVYPQHAYQPGDFLKWLDPLAWQPADSYYSWRDDGWRRQRAVRYPMGKGAKPLYSLYRGSKLGYVDARKKIYIPAYAECVLKTRSYRLMYEYMLAPSSGMDLVLRDFDGYDYEAMGMTLRDVVNNPKKTMGHAFVIAMLLTGEYENCLK